MSKYSRSYVFTCFNTDWSYSEESLAESSVISYVAYQLEKCPTTARLHYQGMVHMSNPRSIKYLKQTFCPDGFYECMRGTLLQAKKYCTKDDTRVDGPWEFGSLISHQGRRTDLAQLKEDINSGISEFELMQEHFGSYLKYRSSILAARKLVQHKLRKAKGYIKKDVRIYWGAPGTGKTRSAYEEFPELFKLDPANNLWWDGYDGEDCILIDDFYGQIKHNVMLNLLDGYPMRLEIKNGFTTLQATKIIITSNTNPREWYPNVPEAPKAAFFRRVSVIKEFKELNKHDLT